MDSIFSYVEFCRARNLSRATITNRTYALRRLERAVGCDPLHATKEELRTWRDSLTLSPGAMLTELSCVANYYRWALDEELISVDPSRKLTRPRTPHYLPRPIPERDLLDATSCAPERIRPWLALMGWCGLRACEVASLRRADIQEHADPPMLTICGKGARVRVVPLGPAVIEELRRAGLPSRGYVFPRMDGQPGPNSPATVSRLVNRHLHRCGLAATGHQARHRYGTQMYRASRDLRMVGGVMGHADTRTTSGYVAYSNKKAWDAARKLDRSLRKAS